MQPVTLDHTGNPPITFRGEIIATTSGQRRSNTDQTRWFCISLYKTEGGQYVAKVLYRTMWPEEDDHHDVRVVKDRDEALEFLQEYDVVPHITLYDKRREEVLAKMCERYQCQLSLLLGQAEIFKEVE